MEEQKNKSNQTESSREEQSRQQAEQPRMGQENTNEHDDQLGENAGGNFGREALMDTPKNARNEQPGRSEEKSGRPDASADEAGPGSASESEQKRKESENR